MPWVGFELTIPAFERAMTVHATVIDYIHTTGLNLGNSFNGMVRSSVFFHSTSDILLMTPSRLLISYGVDEISTPWKKKVFLWSWFNVRYEKFRILVIDWEYNAPVTVITVPTDDVKSSVLTQSLMAKRHCTTKKSEEFYLHEYKTVQPIESQLKFPCLINAGFLFGLVFNPEYGGDTFLQNVRWLSTDYMPLYPRK
jgi:hypothetical protein